MWGRADDMEWRPNDTHGPGCAQKGLLRGSFSAAIYGLWIMRVNPGGLNYVHSGRDHQLCYIWKAPQPSKTPRDSRTEGARWIMNDRIFQTRVGDASYTAGAPRIDQHGTINESHKEELIYVAIGAYPPGARPGPGAQKKAGTPPGRSQ